MYLYVGVLIPSALQLRLKVSLLFTIRSTSVVLMTGIAEGGGEERE